VKSFGRWLVETRIGRTLFRVSAIVLGALLIFLGISAEVKRETRSIVHRIVVLEHVRPIDVLRTCLRTPSCRRLVADAPKLSAHLKGGDALQPSHQGGQQPSPPKGGHHGSGHGKHTPHTPAGPAGPEPTPSTPAEPAPEGPTGHKGPEKTEPGPVGKAVGQVGEAVKGVAEDVHGKACGLVPDC
jgi:hypothetical protein